MPARLLVIGLDAVEAPVLERLREQGRVPTLEALERQAVTARMVPACMDLLPGAIWQDLTTGVSVGSHGDYYPTRLHTGEAVTRAIDPTAHADSYYWARAAHAGRRVAVIDQPLVPVITTVPATVVAEWHVHDQLWGRGTHPEELQAELEARHSHRPLDRCDSAHDMVRFGNELWLDHLLEELRVKTDMVLDVLAREPWDLFQVGFSDGHCVGHQFWHLHDPDSPHHSSDASPRLRGAVEEVCEALDTAVGRIIDAAEADTTVVFTSHGMGLDVGGTQLLRPILARLGMGDARRLPPWIRPILPMTLFQRFTRRHPALGRRAAYAIGKQGFIRSGTKAMALPNNRVGAIRLNVVGREPDGAIAPADVDAELEALTAELLALRQPSSGELIVRRVVRPAEVYGPNHHPDLPDLLVEFRRDLGELAECDGPRSGHIEASFRRPDYQRTGDHTDSSRVWLASRDNTEASAIDDIDTLDLAPTLLALLEVPTDGCDGTVVQPMVAARPASAR